MRIKPNRTIVDGRVVAIELMADGWGADVQFAVEASHAAEGYDDFLQAKPGTMITVFAADTAALETGKAYRLTVSVGGGPQAERIVVEDARPR